MGYSRFLVACIIALLALATPWSAGAWDSLTVADDPLVRMPGSQPGDGIALDQISSCDNCHDDYDPVVEPSSHWRGSMMAQALRDPLFWAAVTVAAQDSIWAVGRPNGTDLCLRCHTPEGWLEGRSDPTNGAAFTGSDFDGVHCRFCHQEADPFYADTFSGAREGLDPGYWDETDLSATTSTAGALATFTQDAAALSYATMFDGSAFFTADRPTQASWSEAGGGAFFVDPADIRRASFADANANHSTAYSRFHKSKYFCQSCHDVSNPVLHNIAHIDARPGDPVTLPSEQDPAYSFFHIERTFSEFMLSDYGLPGGATGSGAFAPALFTTSHPGNAIATCQDCHMADAPGKGCNKNQAPLRPSESIEHPNSGVPVHDFAGGNAWIPWILASTDPASPNADAFNAALFNQGPELITIDLSAGEGIDSAALLATVDRAQAMLATAASITDLAYDDGSGALTFRVANHTGHKLLSGFPEGRRMFVNIQLYASTTLIHEVNPYDHAVGTLKGLPPTYSPNSPVLGAGEEHSDELVYEIHSSSTLTGEHATFHVVLSDGRYKDNRIPPRGFRIAEAGARLSTPTWAGSEALDYFTTAEYAGGYDEVNLTVPAGADAIIVSLYYQTTSREFIEFLRDQILGTATTLTSPTPSGEANAYIIQSDPFFTKLKAWGDTIWQLWDHNKDQPGAAPFLLAENTWLGEPCVPSAEVCDGLDNDCNLLIDDGLPVFDYWPDGDSDLFGNGAVAATSACAQPSGYVDNAADCNDGDGAINPDASEITCDLVDNDCSAATLDDPDGDDDGHGTCSDCNDAEPAMFPGNPELCDGLDNDCNGTIDDGLTNTDYWPDGDDDGFGDASATATPACVAPPGHVADHSDCDDSSAAISPNADELTCDSIDNDCNAATLDDPDVDDDGHGSCTDCDDNEPLAFPGNTEICDDTIDNDCDGDTDSADSDCAGDDGDDSGGCGCQGSPAPGGSLILLVLVAALVGRRRRQSHS